NMLLGSDSYSVGLVSALTSGYRRSMRAMPSVPIVPARRPQHSLGSSACACATISSASWRGSKRRIDVDKVIGPSEDNCLSNLACVLPLQVVANAKRKPVYQERLRMARDRVILAYSGGLDTSVMVPWIGEKYNLDVVAVTCDLGQGDDIEKIRQKAIKTGAVDAVAIDARNLFVDLFVWPALMAGALYEGKYPLATALGRPLIAKLMVDVAKDKGA